MVAFADSSLDTSEDLKKQISEQTSNLETAEPEETEEAVSIEEPEEPEVEATEEKPSEEKETTEEPEPKETREKLYKLKVEGKEELLPEGKIIEYAQKGRFLEKERQKQKEELERLKKSDQPPPVFDKTKVNEEFLRELQDDPFGTLVKFNNMLNEQRDGQTREERRAERKFQQELEKDVPYWKDLRPIYEEFRDMGHDKTTAFAMAEADYLKALLIQSRESGRKEGESKAKLKAKAVLPSGEKRTRETTSLPSPKDIEKMTSEQLAKYLRRTKVPGW